MTDNLEIRERLSEVRDAKGRRWYRTPDGELYPSVSTILEVVAKPALEKWKTQRLVAWVVDNLADWTKVDEGVPVSRFDPETTAKLLLSGPDGGGKSAAGTGTSIHNIIEKYLKGILDEDTIPERLRPALKHFKTFEQEYNFKPLFVEPEIVNRTVGYAGSPDWIAELDGPGFEGGVTVLGDNKTGSGIFAETAAQTCFYAKAEEILDVGPMPVIQATAALWIRPRGFALYKLEYSPRVWAAAVGAKRLFDFGENQWAIRGSAVSPDPIKSKGEDW